MCAKKTDDLNRNKQLRALHTSRRALRGIEWSLKLRRSLFGLYWQTQWSTDKKRLHVHVRFKASAIFLAEALRLAGFEVTITCDGYTITITL